MRPLSRKAALILPAVVLLSSAFLAGCENRETVYYNRWEHETHRPHVELNRRAAAEQKEYWDWRHKLDEHR
jgi:hypothetical protein